NTLLELMEKQSPTHLAVAFDTSDPTPRHDIFPEYKANRDEMPEDLALQIPEIKRVIRAFNIPVIECPGWEADDIIGTLAKRAEEDPERDFETFMVTPDKDFAQLVTRESKIYKPGLRGAGHEILDYDSICEKWEVKTPEQVVDILGLWGDASDNIPGVPGIGEKTAKKLMKLYGSVEGLLENVEELKGKQKENVENNREQALLSKKLVKIMTDAPVDVTWDEIEITERDDGALKDLFVEFEFNQLGKRLFGNDFQAGRGHSTTVKQADGSVEGEQTAFAELKTIADVKKAYEFFPPDDAEGRADAIRRIAGRESFCFDLETDGLDEKTAHIIGAAFSWKADTGIYIGLSGVENDPILEELRAVLENPDTEKIGHNLKFDIGVLHWNGVRIGGRLFDTMLAHTLIEPDQRHKMDFLAEKFLGYTPMKYDDVFGTDDDSEAKEGQMDMFDALDAEPEKTGPEFAKIAQYAAEDADVTWQLAAILREKLKELGQEQLFFEIEAPLTPVLVEMEAEGIRIDTDILSEIGEGLGKNIAEMEKKVFEQAGEEFNVASPKQVGEILFDKLKLVEKPKKTKTGQYKTDEQTLSGLAVEHQIVRDLLAFREASKLKSTYVDALPHSIFEKTGRVHTTFHQLMTATGRLASNDPNLQNIPIRTEQGREIRKAFVPRDENHILMAADYSQIELRVMASLCQDPAMIEAFNSGVDIHQATAARVFGVELDAVEPSMRRKAKMVNFGIIYGISAFGLAQRLGGEVSRTEAGEIIEEYFKQYPKVKEFQETTIEQAKETGYVETITKRRRYLRDINSRSWTMRSAAERVAINTPIQGTAADMIKIAMVRVAKALEDGDYQTRMLLQVHDELVFDLHREEEAEVTPLVVEAMKSALPLAVPVVVDTGTGENWLDAH
ncbi:MAG: DNA polymerase I, partial [Verrucomicrobiales bacterium]|nr:DNA polymerase I [Verrucomicrobiales bacterium]